MAKVIVSSGALALVLAVPALAAAQSAPASGAGRCPPGSWFCASAPEEQVAPAERSPQLEPLPDPDFIPPPPPPAPPPPPPPRFRRPPAEAGAPGPRRPPVTMVRPPPPPLYVTVLPRRASISPPTEWGLNLHLEQASIGTGYEHDTGMGGGGAGLRFKPERHFGLETDLDFVGGHGYVGDLRHEKALTFNGLLFINPRSRAQVYLLAGFGWSWANSRNDPNDPSAPSYNNSYTYFGGQAGIGLELRLSRVLAFNVDLRGFVRTRTDALAASQPEFTNAQGQTTNTSGGGLFTGGMSLYF